MFRKEENSSKWQGKLVNENYPLTLADMDFPLYAPFKEELTKKISDLNNFTYKNRSKEYFDSVIRWYNKHHIIENSKNPLLERFEFKPEHFIESPSICNLIGCSILAFTKEKESVLIFTPVYSFYIYAIKSLNRKIVCSNFKEISFQEKDTKQHKIFSYEFDSGDFEEKMDQYKPKLIILCNPHNPSGKIFTESELNIIVKKAEQYNTYILSDEIMGDFTLYPRIKNANTTKNTESITNFTSLINFSYQKIIVANSISKVFNCESVQGGYGLIKSESTRKLFNLIGYKAFKLLTNELSLMLTPIIYTKIGEEWIEIVNKIVDENLKIFAEKFKYEKCLKIFNLESGYLATIEFDFTSLNSVIKPTNEFLATILAKHCIFFVDMKEYFYPPTERNLFRIAIAIKTEEFQKFVNKFEECLNYIKNIIANENKIIIENLKRPKL